MGDVIIMLKEHIDCFSKINSGYKGRKVWGDVWAFLQAEFESSDSRFGDGFSAIFAEAIHHVNHSDFSASVLLEISRIEEKFGVKLPPSYVDFLLAGGAKLLQDLSEKIYEWPKTYHLFFDSEMIFNLGNVSESMAWFFQDYDHADPLNASYLDQEETDELELSIYNDFSDYSLSLFFFPLWLKPVLNQSIVVAEECQGNGALIWISPYSVTRDGEWETTVFFPADERVRFASFAGGVVYLLAGLYAYAIDYDSSDKLRDFKEHLFNLIFEQA